MLQRRRGRTTDPAALPKAGLGRNGRDMLLAESAGVKKNIQVSLFHVSFSAAWLWLLM